jgi:protein-tyrosine phosphatase
MLRRGLVHFIASDGHDVTDRPPRLDQAFEAVSKRMGADHAQLLLIDNPGAVLRGEAVRVDMPQRKPWYKFWK